MNEGHFHYIAKRRRAKEHRRFLAGSGRYVADVELPGMLHVALVASPHPSARILFDRPRGGVEVARRALGRHGRRDPIRDRADDERARSAEGAALAARGRRCALCRRVGGGGRGGDAIPRRGRGGAHRHRIWRTAGRGRSRSRASAGRAARPSGARLEPALSPQVHVGAGRAGFRGGAAPHRLSRALAPQRHRADRDVRRRRALGFGGAAHRDLGLGADAEIRRSDRARAAPAGERRARPLRHRRGWLLWRQARLEACGPRRLSRAALGRSRAPHRGPAREFARRRRARARPHLRRSKWRSTTTARCAR